MSDEDKLLALFFKIEDFEKNYIAQLSKCNFEDKTKWTLGIETIQNIKTMVRSAMIKGVVK